jgi:hypothetical protein
MTFTTAQDSTWIVGVKSDAIRIWDATDGSLVWSGTTRWCRDGIRLYPPDTCSLG